MSRKLDHLDGGRTVLALWILMHHFPDHPEGGHTLLQGDRAHVAVSYFVVLSGFVTHWVYGRPERWDGRLLRFYARRLDRIVLTSWLGMLAILVMELLSLSYPGAGLLARDEHEAHRYFHAHENVSDVLDPERLLGCFSFLRWYYAPGETFDLVDCPNLPTWTVAALILCWLLYPLLRWLLVKAWDRGAAAGIAACSLLASSWLVTIVTLIALWAAHGFTFPTDRQHDMGYYWPPANVGDFCLGVAAAALVHRAESSAVTAAEATPLLGASGPGATASRQRRLVLWARASWAMILADAAAITTAATIVALPDIGPHRTGPEALLDHAFAPLLAAWIYGSSVGPDTGLVGRLLRQPAFAWPGKYAFHVYILWYPLRAFIGIYTFLDLTRPADAVTALLIHWIVSALYAEYVEVQLVRLLRGESCAKPVAVVQLGEQQQQLKLDGPSAEIRRRDEEIARLKEQYETLETRHEMLQQQNGAKGPALEQEVYDGD